VIGVPAPARGLGLFLAVLAVQRAGELIHSARNVKRLKARGARECGSAHFPLLVLIHLLFPVCLVTEVFAVGARPGPLWPVWLGFWLAAQALRYTAVQALGERWTVGILVLPGMQRVRSGPYRFLRHPNYLAVVIELLAAPLMFGAWRTAVAISVANLFVLWIRIRAEEGALRGAAAGPR
jgi:methyltransferase